jgi:hypothetical protein
MLSIKHYGFEEVDSFDRSMESTFLLLLLSGGFFLLLGQIGSYIIGEIAWLAAFLVVSAAFFYFELKLLYIAREGRYNLLQSEKKDLETTFETILKENPHTLEDYVELFLSEYGDAYSPKLNDFKRLLYLRQVSLDGIEDKIENKIELDFCMMLQGNKVFNDLELIHNFALRYGSSYNESDLELLKKTLKNKGIQFHTDKFLKNLVDLAVFTHEYTVFEKYMSPGLRSSDENECIKRFLLLYGEKNEDKVYMLHLFMKERSSLCMNFDDFEEYLRTKIFEISLKSEKNKLDIKVIDGMNGYEFEDFVGNLYENMGYEVEKTSLSNDQGADLLVFKHGERTAVQVKNYASNVSNQAIQEVVASMKHYNCSSCHVVTNSYFTKSAVDLANSNGVKLIDRDELKLLINEHFT